MGGYLLLNTLKVNNLVTMQAIWEDAIQRQLGIDLIDLPQYRAVLVIPVLYK